jgi:hypothetical protein
MSSLSLSRRTFLAALGLGAARSFSQTPAEIVRRYDFNDGSHGWLPGFTDYGLDTGGLERLAEIRPLPPEINSDLRGYYLQSMNRSDDMFMFLKKELDHRDGVEPDRPYSVSVDIELLSNAPSGCAGAGGAPGEAVWLKAGVSPIEPVAVVRDQHVRLNLDKGDQANGGFDAGIVSNIANGMPCQDAPQPPAVPPYIYLHRVYHHPRLVAADPNGRLWVFVGTDSGYEGLTGLYYYSILITLRPMPA